jgi:hypothetical protein
MRALQLPLEPADIDHFPHRVVEFTHHAGGGYGVRMFVPHDSDRVRMIDLSKLMKQSLKTTNVQVGLYSDRCPPALRYVCFNGWEMKFGTFGQGDTKTASDLQRPDFLGAVDALDQFHPPDPSQVGITIEPNLRKHYDAISAVLQDSKSRLPERPL